MNVYCPDAFPSRAPRSFAVAKTYDGGELRSPADDFTITSLNWVYSYSRRLKELMVNLSPISHALPALPALLRLSMPYLEDLAVEVETEEMVQGWVPIELALSSQALFPSLQNLVFRGVRPQISPPILANLRSLVLENREGLPLPLSAGDVLNCLRSLHNIEELTIRNYLCPSGMHQRVNGDPYELTYLREVDIEEHPSTIALILSYFVVRVGAHIQLSCSRTYRSPNPTCADLFTMIPQDRRCLPILREIATVNVLCTTETCTISARTRYDGSITLEADTAALGDPQDTSLCPQLFQELVQSFGKLFPGAPVTELSFLGSIDVISQSTWVAVLDQYTAVRYIGVRDPQNRSSGIRLVEALTSVSPTTGRALCHDLAHLNLNSATDSTDILERLCQCFEWRPWHDAWMVIDHIHVWLMVPKSWPSSATAHYRKELARFAEDCELTVVEIV
ncbi:hypothetical protein BD414DRAFT_86984 [Trametes punicea]|nr:hypothetical protein BD414DRAFT_86984 [Trametes punicea]